MRKLLHTYQQNNARSLAMIKVMCHTNTEPKTHLASQIIASMDRSALIASIGIRFSLDDNRTNIVAILMRDLGFVTVAI